MGAGDLAFHHALNLGNRNAVMFLNRGSETRRRPLLRERAADNPRISYRENTWVEGVRQGASRQGRSWSLPAAARRGRLPSPAIPWWGRSGEKPQLDSLSEDFLNDIPDWQRDGRLVSRLGTCRTSSTARHPLPSGMA